MSAGRVAAFRIRTEAERGRRLDRALAAHVAGLDPRERAFAHELSYGVTRLRGRLDHLIAPHVRRGFENASSDAVELLRMGAYQAFYMSAVPEYAAVSQTVEHARAEGGRSITGFCNAVLRKVISLGCGSDRFPDRDADKEAWLSTYGSHPSWLVRRWLAQWNASEVEALVEHNNRRPRLYVVPVNTSVDEARDRLARSGIAAVLVEGGSRCLLLPEGASAREALDVIGAAIVQDPAANLVSMFADVPSGTIVADLCAAPGGKLLGLPTPPETAVAFDRSESRIHMVRENARRVGRRVALAVADARRPPLRSVDTVLLDAPCTGTGTLSRNPDARWRLTPESVPEMAKVQAELLESAAAVVGEGGVLVYSTCSLEREENEDVVSDFLRRDTRFRLEPGADIPVDCLDSAAHLVVRPWCHGSDGAFAARMRRAG